MSREHPYSVRLASMQKRRVFVPKDTFGNYFNVHSTAQGKNLGFIPTIMHMGDLQSVAESC